MDKNYSDLTVNLDKIATRKTIKQKQFETKIFKILFERKCLMFGVKIKQSEDLFCWLPDCQGSKGQNDI